MNKIYKLCPFLAPRFDVWHSVTQSPRYYSINESCSRIITIHDLNFLHDSPSPKRSRKALKRLQDFIEMSDLVTVISNFTKKEIQEHLDTSRIPVVVNYVGLFDITKDPSDKPSFIREGKKFFFTIGQVVSKKNFHVLIDMMELMPEYDLYICGEDYSKYSNMIKNKIKEKGLENIFVTGPISMEEKVWMYQNCHAFVFPSKFEGFGIPIVDGMRFEKPVFSSKLTSLEEIGGQYAYFWDNFDPHHMKKIIEENVDAFYSDPQRISEQKEYANSFSIEQHFQTYLDIYRNMPKKKKSIFKTFKNYVCFLRN